MTSSVPLPTPENPYRSARDISKMTGFKPRTVRMWILKGRIKGGFVISGEWRVLHSDLVEFLQAEYGEYDDRST